MTDDTVEATRVALEQKLSSIDRELVQWRADSDVGMPLRKHHYQIKRVADTLGAYSKDVADELKGLVAGRSGVKRIEFEILEIHRIWEFFRSKLVLRYFDWFRPYLDAADEFAWACYEPARDHLQSVIVPRDEVKEPPLVYFNGGWSPLTMSRGGAYQVAPAAGGALNSSRLATVLADLPIPIIAVPWYQVRHFPDAVVIGHEVGHNVEHDMKLTTTIGRLTAVAAQSAGIDGKRTAGWLKWSGEIFGDVYASLATGPAFASAMEAFLESDPSEIDSEVQGRTPDDYVAHPPTSLRMHICYETLRQLGHTEVSKARRDAWVARHKTDAMADFHEDIEPVVRSLIDGPYPEFDPAGSLTKVLSFGPGLQKLASDNAESVNRSIDPSGSDIRVLVAAGRLAFDASPAKYTATNAAGKDGNDRIVEQIVGLRNEEVRGGENRPDDTESADSRLGRSLLERIREGHRLTQA
jgi:hypothetical protein